MEVLPSLIERKISGSTLGERHASLNQLVREPVAEVLEDMSNMKQVDLVYMGRLANHTKNASVICELLKSKDSMVVSVALQSKWFFTATTHPHMANVRYFEKEVFPYATYHAICRIVSTFSACLQDEAVAEDLYKYIGECYGKTLAVKLLPKCSVTFIRSQIMDSLSDVPCAQMFYIYKKDKAMALEYLEKYLTKEKADKLPLNYSLKMNYNKIWKLLAEDSPELFFNLLDKFPNDIKVPLGHRVVKEVLKVGLEKIIQNPDKYSDTITKKYVVSILKDEELEKYLLNTLPSKQDDLLYYDNAFINLKPEYCLKMLMKLHPVKYNGVEFLDRKDIPNWNLFEYLSKEERSMWALKKIKNIKDKDCMKEDEYFKYLNTSDGIPRLQALCKNTSDIQKRSKYLDNMVECCKINNDKDALLELLQYVAKRHKNDQASLRHNFLHKVYDTFTFSELSSEQWKLIREMLNYLIVEKEIERNYWFDIVRHIECQYMEYCISNGLDITESISRLSQFDLYYLNLYYPQWIIKDIEVEFKVFSLYAEKYKQIITQCEDPTDGKYAQMIVNLLTSIVNNLSSKVSVTDYPWIIDYIKANWTNRDDNDYWAHSIFELIVKDKNISDTFVKNILTSVINPSFVKFYIMFRPEILLNNVQHFLTNSFKYRIRRARYNKIYEKIGTYFMQPLGQKIVEALEGHMKEDSVKDSEQAGVDIIYLSYLLPYTQREALLRTHTPANLTVDLENDRHQYEVGGILAKYMKTFNPPVNLHTLMPFIGGDYLKYSLSSLLSLPFKMSRSEAKAFILDLVKKPVSVKKHSVRMAYFLCPREDLLPLYKSLWEGDKNSSIRDVVFCFTFKLLVTEENMDKYQDIWITLKYFMSSLTENDINIFKYLTRPQYIMPALVTDYSQTCWMILKQLAAKEVNVADHVSTLSQNLRSCMKLLSEEFCEQIITEYLTSAMNKESHISNELLMFLVDYLVKAREPEVQNKHSDTACGIFKDYINTNWNTTVDEEYKYRKIIRDFVLQCCTQSLNHQLELSPVNLLKNISEMLSSTLPRPSILDLHIALNTTICYKELLLEPRFLSYSPDSDSHTPTVSAMECELFESLGEKISRELNDFSSQYGIAATGIFVKGFNNWMCTLTGTDTGTLLNEKKKETLVLYLICGLMLSANVTQQCFIMAIDLLPVVSSNDKDNFKLYNQLLNRIIKEGDVTVKMILNCKVEHDVGLFEI